MSDAVRQLKEKELNDLIQRRNDFEQVAQQDLQKRYNELLAPIIDKAKAIQTGHCDRENTERSLNCSFRSNIEHNELKLPFYCYISPDYKG